MIIGTNTSIHIPTIEQSTKDLASIKWNSITVGDEIAEKVFDKVYQYAEAQELAYQFDEWLKDNTATKEKAIALLHRIGIYENGELSDKYQ